MKNTKIKWDKKYWLSIVAAPVITALLLLLAFAAKGVYPFGSRNVSYYDMSQSLIPIYYHTYDVLHGKAGLFFDWYTGAGSTMADTAGNFVLNPFNLFFLFVKRDMILESMSFFLMLKLVLTALSMSVFTGRRWPNLSPGWVIMAGLSYASCGFVLQYYCNIQFLDIVALFPLLVYGYEKMIYQNKRSLYTVILALCLLTNIYLSLMICIYLILSGFLTMRYRMNGEDRKGVSLRIGLCTLNAFLLSAAVTVPNVIALMNSSRATTASQGGYFASLYTVLAQMPGQKHFMLYGSEIMLALVLCYIGQKNKTKEQRFFFKRNLWMLLLLLIPMFVEPVNQVWHIGGYMHFPMRFGYMLCLETWMFVCDYVSQNKKSAGNPDSEGDEKEKKGVTLATLLAPAMLPLIAIILWGYMQLFLQFGIRNSAAYTAYWLIALLLTIYFFLACNARKSKQHGDLYTKVLCFLAITLQAGLGFYGFLAPAEEYSLECGDEVIQDSQEIGNAFQFDGNPMTRVKDSEACLNANYGFVLEEGSLANWTLGAARFEQDELKKLGYSTSYTRLLDNGGTLFSDALLGITDLITDRMLESPYCVLKEKSEHFYHYQYDFPSVDAILLSNEQMEQLQELDEVVNQDDYLVNPFSYQNAIYQILSADKERLIELPSAEQLISKSSQDPKWGFYVYELAIPAEGLNQLYIYSASGQDTMYTFYIEDEQMEIPLLSYKNNFSYPVDFRNGMIDCGTYEDTTIHLKVETCYDNLDDLQIGLLKLPALTEWLNTVKTEPAEVSVQKDTAVITKETGEGHLFLPLAYHDGYNISVNRQKREAEGILNSTFLVVPVSEGLNVISVTYRPTGLLLSLCGIVVMCLYSCIYKLIQGVDYFCYLMICLLMGGICFGIYLIPLSSYITVLIRLLL